MPTYEYRCSNEQCSHEWEEDQKISDPKIDTCPICMAKTAERLISTASFVLKGNGWFKSGGY